MQEISFRKCFKRLLYIQVVVQTSLINSKMMIENFLFFFIKFFMKEIVREK